jgi:hypothetical protein
MIGMENKKAHIIKIRGTTGGRRTIYDYIVGR